MYKSTTLLLLVTLPALSNAEKPQSSYTPPSIITTESMVQMVGALFLVLAAIAITAWLLKRFAIFPAAASGVIKTIASTSVGQRERVVIIEIGEKWLVLGVAPGRVNTLQSMDKQSLEKLTETQKNQSSNLFPEQLNRHLNPKNGQEK